MGGLLNQTDNFARSPSFSGSQTGFSFSDSEAMVFFPMGERIPLSQGVYAPSLAPMSVPSS